MKELLSINAPIFPGKGIGTIDLGMSIVDLYPCLQVVSYYDFEVEAFFPRLFIYIYQESLELYIDIFSGKLVRIDVCGNYQGKYQNTVGIGDKVQELKNIRKDISFDEEYLILGNNELFILTDYENEIEDLEDLNESSITRITLELPAWNSF